MKNEFQTALMELKNWKTPGPIRIPAEFWKNDGVSILLTLKEVFFNIKKDCYGNGTIRSDFYRK